MVFAISFCSAALCISDKIDEHSAIYAKNSWTNQKIVFSWDVRDNTNEAKLKSDRETKKIKFDGKSNDALVQTRLKRNNPKKWRFCLFESNIIGCCVWCVYKCVGWKMRGCGIQAECASKWVKMHFRFYKNNKNSVVLVVCWLCVAIAIRCLNGVGRYGGKDALCI